MRCDLHVHTLHSGLCTVPVARRFCRESYSEPEEVYFRLKQMGMDLVTVTDHDSIGAAAALSRYPDFFASEEVTVTMPSGNEAHMAVYGLNERQHFEIQQRRHDLPSLLAYLREQRLPFGVNHIFSGLTGRRTLEDFAWFEQAFPLLEILNGSMLARANREAASFARRWRKGTTAGSDSHTLRSVGNAWTEVPGAGNAQEFLDGLRAGHGRASGSSGSYIKLTTDVAYIISRLFRETPLAALLAPAVLALPAVTLVNWLSEAVFAGHWSLELARKFPSNSGGDLHVIQVSEEAPA